jgi:hypothetical protein
VFALTFTVLWSLVTPTEPPSFTCRLSTFCVLVLELVGALAAAALVRARERVRATHEFDTNA